MSNCHALHATVDVLEIAAQYSVASDEYGVKTAMRLAAVNSAWGAAVGNVAADELVARHCVFVHERDACEHDPWVEHLTQYGDVPCTPADPLCLNLVYNPCHLPFPAHTAMLLLASRGNGARAFNLRRIQALSVTVFRGMTIAVERAFSVLALLLHGAPSLLASAPAHVLSGVRRVALVEKGVEDPKVLDDATSMFRTRKWLCALAGDLGAGVEELSVSLLSAPVAPPLQLRDLVLERMPRLRALTIRAPLVDMHEIALQRGDLLALVRHATPCRELEHLFFAVPGIADDHGLIALWDALGRTRLPLRRVRVKAGDVIACARGTLAFCGALLHEIASAGHDKDRLTHVDFDTFVHGFNARSPLDLDTRPLEALATKVLRALPGLRSFHAKGAWCHSELIWAMATEEPGDGAPEFVSACDSLSCTVRDVAQFARVLRRLPRLTSLEIRFPRETVAETYGPTLAAIAATPRGHLRELILESSEQASLPPAVVEAAGEELFRAHGATLCTVRVGFPHNLLTGPQARHCTALVSMEPEDLPEVEVFRTEPAASYPSLEHISIPAVLQGARGDVELARRFIGNNGALRTAVTHLSTAAYPDIRTEVGIPEADYWELVLFAASRCPSAVFLSVAGTIPEAVFSALLRCLRCLRSVEIYPPLGPALWRLAKPGAPSLSAVYVYNSPGTDEKATRAELWTKIANAQSHIETLRC